jgi:hypothetical protein
VGTFEFFQLAPHLMRHGVAWSETRIPYRLATAEKALFDTLYISTKKARRFRALPELELSARGFSHRRFRALIRDLDDARTASAITRRFGEIARSEGE